MAFDRECLSLTHLFSVVQHSWWCQQNAVSDEMDSQHNWYMRETIHVLCCMYESLEFESILYTSSISGANTGLLLFVVYRGVTWVNW